MQADPHLHTAKHTSHYQAIQGSALGCLLESLCDLGLELGRRSKGWDQPVGGTQEAEHLGQRCFGPCTWGRARQESERQPGRTSDAGLSCELCPQSTRAEPVTANFHGWHRSRRAASRPERRRLSSFLITMLGAGLRWVFCVCW